MNEKTFEMTMLLDFYGALLTEKQRESVSLHYNEDLSLSEIAEIMGISRQGVRDLLVRAQATLEDTEAKIALVKRAARQREGLKSMSQKLKELEKLSSGPALETVLSLQSQLEEIEGAER